MGTEFIPQRQLREAIELYIRVAAWQYTREEVRVLKMACKIINPSMSLGERRKQFYEAFVEGGDISFLTMMYSLCRKTVVNDIRYVARKVFEDRPEEDIRKFTRSKPGSQLRELYKVQYYAKKKKIKL